MKLARLPKDRMCNVCLVTYRMTARQMKNHAVECQQQKTIKEMLDVKRVAFRNPYITEAEGD